ncbi:response regulator [Chryseobacterium sp. R2A-55]|uniref:response regulator n=1 Tax=Chryseobacterium sp. R2A-55 TaxID=2744445 RepID=UPI001F1B9597|nr:response regulator transcription factor [Chryseobacterium sp. R2A-55]
MDKIRIIIVDDHPMVQEGLRAMFNEIRFVDLVATAKNAFEAMELIKKFQPGMVLTDINMPEITGIELTARIKAEFPKIKIVGMSTFNERGYITQIIANGADGFLLKNAPKEEIEKCLLSVYEGKMYLSVDVNLKTSEKKELGEIPVLSTREKEVLELIAEGLTNNQIAEKIFVSPYTVDSHRKSLMTKLNAGNTAILIKQAIKFNLIQ